MDDQSDRQIKASDEAISSHTERRSSQPTLPVLPNNHPELASIVHST